MHIVFLTYGFTPHNSRLMPWRYVLEMAKGIVQTGSNATVITDSNHGDCRYSEGLPAVEAVSGHFSAENPIYRDCIERIKPDVIYVPVARRSSISQKVWLPETIPHFGYFPSAWYNPIATLGLCKALPFRDACMYVLESLVPGGYFVKNMQEKGFAGIVTVTQYTARKLVENGWHESLVNILAPGVDLFQQNSKAPEVFNRCLSRANGRPYILFMGPPTAIRGIYFLLRAFDRAADLLDNISLVCLLRQTSEGSAAWNFKKAVRKLKHGDRVISIENRLTEEDIIAYIRGSRAVVLPFLIVPSEIPLAVMETMALAKPVIVTETGGTSEFVGKAGKVVRQNDVGALSDSIKEVFTNEADYLTMCEEAQKVIRSQRQWIDLARSFVDFTTKVLLTRSKQKVPPSNGPSNRRSGEH